MRLIKSFFEKATMASLLLLVTVTSLTAQNPTYLCELRNDVQVDARTFEFDVYLLRTGATVFEYTSMQFGINVNSGMLNGGTISVTFVSGSSELNSSQFPDDTRLSFDGTKNCIIWTGQLPPGAGNGTIISNTGNGTRVGRFHLSNTVDFGTVTPDFAWSYSIITGYPTKVNAYVGGSATEITVQSSHTTTNLLNNLLNSNAPVQFTVTGGGEYCDGGAGVAVGLSDSESGVTYTLIRGTTDLTPTVAGTGDPISFGNQTVAGTYTVKGSNAGGTTTMTGSAVVTVNPVPDAAGTIAGTASVCQGQSGVTYSVPAITGATSYNWVYSGTGATITGTTNAVTISFASNATAGNLTVQGVNSCGNGTVSANYAIAVNSLPSTSVITGNAAPACGGTGYIYSVTSTAGSSYAWTVPTGSTITAGSGTNSITVTFGTTSGIISVTETNAGGCAGPERTLAVTLQGCGLTANFTGTPLTVCAGSAVTFTNASSGITESTAYSWNFGAGATPATANTEGPHSVTYSTGGSKTVSLTITEGAVDTETKTDYITVNALPPQPVITADGPTTFCAGADVVLTAPESAGYLWSNGATSRSITVTATGNFSVQVTNTAGCQSVLSPTVVVTVNPLPSIPTINPAGSVTICTGTSQTLTSSPAVSYMWSNGEFNQSITVNTTGSYTVRVTNSYGCLSPASLATTVTVNPIPATPTITASGPTTFCSGGSVTLSSSPASGYLWSTGAITPNITVNSTGNYWVRVTDAAGCQSAQSAVTAVTVNPLPSAPTVGTITHPTCTVSTGSVVLGGLPAGSWTVNPGGITGSTSTVAVTGLVAGSHTFTVTNSTGCTSVASAPVVINTQPAVPTVPIVGAVTQPTCAVTTGSVGFSGLPSSGVWTLTRLPGGSTSNGSGTTFTLTGIPSGSYTFTVTNASGCTSAATGTVTINAPLPVPAAPVQTVDCALGSDPAVVTVTSPVGAGYEYRLDAGAYQTGTMFSNVANGNHTITVRNSSGCTTTGTLFSVNCDCANPPLLTLGATSGSTCGVTAVTVSGNTFGGSATSVTITENGGGTVTPVSSTTSPFSFTYTPTAADAGRTVVITVTTNNPLGSPCAAASATYTLTVNANPVAPVPGTVTHPTCAQPSGSVILNNLPAAGEWTITRSPGGTTTTGSGTSTTITGLAPGTYTFTVTNALGCISPASGNVVINAQPDTPGAPVIGTITQPTCALSTGSVELSGLPATGTWTLTRLPGNFTLTGTGATRTVTGISAGTWTFTVANASGCVSPPSAEFVINTQPVTPPAPSIGTITHPTCALATGSIVLENLPANGEWILVRYPGGISSNGTGTSATVSSLAAGTYNFTVTNADGCPSPVSANAVINAQPPTPNPPVVGTITHPTLTVGTGSVVLSGLPSTGTWTLTRYPDGFTSQGTGTTRTVSGLEPGTYTFTVTNSVGCTSASTGDVVINARPGAPVVVINNPPNICSDQTADLTLPAVTAGSDANLTFTYWTDAAATLPLAAPATVPAGTYYIMGTSTAGYSTIRPVVVTADELPVANAGPDQELSYIFGTTLNADIPSIGTGIWELVSGTGEIFNSTAPSTQVNGLTIGENIFSWTVTNGACYPVTDFVTVKVNNLIIPTLITPNQDGANDYLVIKGIETLGRTELMIFDRRGLKVYENSDYDNLWDGVDYNSNPLPEDTYFYVVRAQNGASRSGYIVVRR